MQSCQVPMCQVLARHASGLSHVHTPSHIDKAVRCHELALVGAPSITHFQMCRVQPWHGPDVMVQLQAMPLTMTFFSLSTLFTSSVVTAERLAWRANFCASCKCQQWCA